MGNKTIGIDWVALDFFWYAGVSFVLSFTPFWAKVFVLALALIFTAAKSCFMNFVITSSLTGALAGGLASAIASSLFGATAGYLATAIALVCCLGWISPGVLSAIVAGVISLAAAVMWGKAISTATMVSAIGIGVGAGIAAVGLAEIIGRARNELLIVASRTYTVTALAIASIAGAVLGTLIGSALY